MLPESWTLVRVESEFLIGCCAYGVYSLPPREISARWMSWLAAGGCVLLALSDRPKLLDGLFIPLFFLLIVGLSSDPRTLLAKQLARTGVVHLGKISYSIYLVHALVIVILRQLLPNLGAFGGDHPWIVGVIYFAWWFWRATWFIQYRGAGAYLSTTRVGRYLVSRCLERPLAREFLHGERAVPRRRRVREDQRARATQPMDTLNTTHRSVTYAIERKNPTTTLPARLSCNIAQKQGKRQSIFVLRVLQASCVRCRAHATQADTFARIEAGR